MTHAESARVLDAEDAPAKINLALHVVGRRADGYHEIDSLAVFTALGDRVERMEAGPPLAVAGPFAGALAALDPADNLVLKAARALGASVPLRLVKRLPVASGLGGGSADAAAAIRLLSRMAGGGDTERLADLARGLGADVPMCLASRPLRARGIGERVSPAPDLPDLPVVLVNPRRPVSTPAVFARLERRENPGLPRFLVSYPTPAALAEWLAGTRNDLEAPAIAIEPSIGDALAALRRERGCLLARMSGSGATCFGLFPDPPSAEGAAAAISARRPDWWVASTTARRGPLPVAETAPATY